MEPACTRGARWSALVIVAVVAAAAGVVLLALAPGAQATAEGLPPRPTRTPTMTPTMAPKPSPQPTIVPPPTSESIEAPQGALIELRVRLAAGFPAESAAGLWAVVEWQDSSGGWRPVEGWQGTPDRVAGGVATKAWWLPASLFGQGPFRWVVLDAPGGQRLAMSAEFSLPSQPGQTTQIEMALTP